MITSVLILFGVLIAGLIFAVVMTNIDLHKFNTLTEEKLRDLIREETTIKVYEDGVWNRGYGTFYPNRVTISVKHLLEDLVGKLGYELKYEYGQREIKRHVSLVKREKEKA